MIFLDHAATTPLHEALGPLLLAELQRPQNASSVHQFGQRARTRLETARGKVADLLGLPPAQVVFTSGASESNNLALRGLAAAFPRPLRILTSPLEHSCVRETVDALVRQGRAGATALPVAPEGHAVVPPPDLVRPHDVLCLMAVQNETGAVQPWQDAAARAQETGIRWLCDATQAAGLLDLRPLAAQAAFLSLSSHKVYGPPGVGLLAGRGLPSLAPQITGGPQEGELRAGTQAVALAVAFAEALRLAEQERTPRTAHLMGLEEAFLTRLTAEGVPFRRNGTPTLPGFLNISVEGLAGADAVVALDLEGFCVSSGAACATGVMETSKALAAMFPGDEARARGALRITPGRKTTLEEMERCAGSLARIWRRIGSIRP